MESLKLDSAGDIQFEMIEGQEELAQCCRIGLGTNKGEWFLNPDSGLDYSLFVGKELNEAQLHDELTRGLLQEERIQSVDAVDFTIDRKARKMLVRFEATAADGTAVTLEEVQIDAG
ncbi:DUF2634 domain-containing protein [Paenibacillus caui]|uniref:DUF2634 domain-containing protein n=1 Tax=Paenibacillus caui TaxID=2873927 RepID=UPI001CA834ED|nr:DUF2634 domain-containing protein [Paenibacillus caui]